MAARAPWPVASRVAWWAAVLVAGGSGLELAGRSVARASMLAATSGVDPSPLALVTLTGATGLAALAVLAFERRATATAVMALLLICAFPAGMASQLRLGARLQSDGFYYFAHMRSLWFDHDQDLTNDYRLLGMGDKTRLFRPTPTGHAQSAWTIGPAFVWAPFFGVGHVVARTLHARGQDVAVDGTSFPYRQAICVAGLVWGLAGLFFCYLVAARLASGAWAAFGTVLLGGGTFLLWYTVKEPTMTHAPSMAVVAMFTWGWLATRGRRTRAQWVWLGLLAGFMVTVRWQNVLFALLPATEWVVGAEGMRRAGDRRALIDHALSGVVFTAASVVGFLPQMLAWNAIYGHLFAVSPLGPPIRFGGPKLIDVLWSARNGLLATSPILVVAVLGLFRCWRRDRLFAVAAIITMGVVAYFNASIGDWWGADAFGGRRFDGALALLAAGAAVGLEDGARLVAKRPHLAIGACGVAMVLWNLTFMSAALDGVFRLGQPVSFAPLAGRQAEELERWVGNPGSWPVNLIFAARNGVSPADYDLLSGYRFLSDPRQPYGRIDVGRDDNPWLGDGWNAPEQEGDLRFRWAEQSASVLIVLDYEAPLRVQLHLHAFTWPAAPPLELTTIVNGRAQPSQTVPDGWGVVEQSVGVDAWKAGVNRVTLSFSRAARPADVIGSADRRQLAAAVDYVRVEVEAH